MEVRLTKATEQDANIIHETQIKSFKPLLEEYKDYATNPGYETMDRVKARIHNPSGGFYLISADEKVVGAICVHWKENGQYWISPMFILPAYQGKGIAQKSINLIEEMFPQAKSWELATIMEEERNCYLYEKMGYFKTGVTKRINEYANLVFYKKEC
ncbi:GNAT family N-acetyltransferase [Alkalibacillus haloalkaliphilus]|uniref:GNAT family N-acetyltransferase n=1 Tax=Alkalibacillus haloalkaliphilus TaxID=94136 RepID=UPI00031B15A3|nr:GNAT family N-acetyltransferase [Alkalibacillus haloalkaliphilus]